MLPLNDEMSMLLRKCLSSQRIDLINVVDSEEIVKVDEDLGNELRDAVLNEFLRVGLKEDYEPNEIGLKLEQLIDQLGRLFMP